MLEAVQPAVQFERRLAAVAFADIAGFSLRVGQDDIGTIGAWKRLRNDLIEPRLTQFRGRLLNVIGDGLFVAFQSVVDAVNWAMSVQTRIAGDTEISLQLRIGINVEDVLIDEGDLYGDGVNIAARIQTLASPGGVVVTSTVRDHVWNKVNLTFVDMGERSLKNIRQLIRVYSVEPETANSALLTTPPRDRSSVRRPAVAVLPFRNLGADSSEDYFGAGITEDIITALSRTRSMMVIARDSTLRYQRGETDSRRIASELGVRYLINGSVRRLQDRLRISAALTDVDRGTELWSDNFDGTVSDLFDFQDRISVSIASVIQPRVQRAELERIAGRHPDSLGAYDLVLRALELFYRFDSESFATAANYLDRALELDENYATAHAYRAWLYLLTVAEARSRNVPADSELAYTHVQHARILDPEDPFVMAVAAHVIALLHRSLDDSAVTLETSHAIHVATDLLEQSLAINPNSPFAWGMSGLTACYRGCPDEALERFSRVWELSPYDPMIFFYTAGAGMAEFIAGNYDKALPWVQKAMRVNGRFLAGMRHLTTILAHLDRLDEARNTARQILAIEPGFSVSRFEQWYPLRPRENLERYVSGLRRAGLPE